MKTLSSFVINFISRCLWHCNVFLNSEPGGIFSIPYEHNLKFDYRSELHSPRSFVIRFSVAFYEIM